jgi:hypothetical protein
MIGGQRLLGKTTQNTEDTSHKKNKFLHKHYNSESSKVVFIVGKNDVFY